MRLRSGLNEEKDDEDENKSNIYTGNGILKPLVKLNLNKGEEVEIEVKKKEHLVLLKTGI